MTLWLTIRRVDVCALVAIAVVGVIVTFGEIGVPVPALMGSVDAAWPLPLIAPLGLAIATTWSLARGDERFESIAPRPVHQYDAALVMTLLAGCSLGVVGLQGSSVLHDGLDAIRNAFGLVGLALIGRWVIGSDGAALLPVGYVVMTAFFGGSSRDGGPLWAWMVRPGVDAAAFSIAVGLFAVGCIVVLIGARRSRPDD